MKVQKKSAISHYQRHKNRGRRLLITWEVEGGERGWSRKSSHEWQLCCGKSSRLEPLSQSSLQATAGIHVPTGCQSWWGMEAQIHKFCWGDGAPPSLAGSSGTTGRVNGGDGDDETASLSGCSGVFGCISDWVREDCGNDWGLTQWDSSWWVHVSSVSWQGGAKCGNGGGISREDINLLFCQAGIRWRKPGQAGVQLLCQIFEARCPKNEPPPVKRNPVSGRQVGELGEQL